MKKFNVIAIFDGEKMKKILMCKRAKEPYAGLYNLIGGKIEKENDGLNEAYREMHEETGIGKSDICLKHLMNIEYFALGVSLEVYYGILTKEAQLVEEVNKLEWVSTDENFFDTKKFAGEGNIGHIIKQVENIFVKMK